MHTPETKYNSEYGTVRMGSDPAAIKGRLPITSLRNGTPCCTRTSMARGVYMSVWTSSDGTTSAGIMGHGNGRQGCMRELCAQNS
jgi:hypothetical protein